VAFVEQARETFGFLVRDFDFIGPHVETGRAFIALEYTGRHIGVSVELDAREEKVDVALVRLVDGVWPPRYRPGWVYVDRIAMTRGIPMQGGTFTLPQSEQQINARLAEEASILRSVADEVLVGDGSQLEKFRAKQETSDRP
jgi:hypothetical protein